MKKLFYTAFIFLMLVSFSSFAQAQSDTKGIYVGLIGGYVMPNDMTGRINVPSSPMSVKYDLDLKDGYLVGAKVGWLTPFSNRALAVEFEYNHLENKIDSWDYMVFDLDMDGKVKIDLFMFNLIARYPTGRFHPYIGSGIGCAYANISDTNSILGSISGGSDVVFAYQLMAGLDFDITKNIIAGISYKYLAPNTISFDNDAPDLWGPGTAELNYKAHNFVLSLSYMF